jgi:serine/threonine protein kinase
MNDKNKKTLRDNGSITPSGVSRSATQKGAQPVIPSGIKAKPPSSQMISSGVSPPGSEITLNNEKYKILKVIARSTGEAEVYLIEKDNQYHVFKYYYPFFRPKENLLKRLKGLHHTDTVDLIDYGYHQDRFFEVMEYAAGGSLADLQQGTYRYLPIKEMGQIKQLVKEIANALYWCHDKGIIHRDLKPENIFFKNPDGTDVIIGDFGISSILEEGLSKHLTGQARTEIYAAPELYQGIDGKTIITKEADYYSLGISLIFIWQAKSPFEGLHSHAIMKNKLEGKVAIPPDMPEELKNLVKGLTTVDPPKRWGYKEVQKWLKGEYVPVYHRITETRYPDFHFGTIHGEDMTVNDPAELARLLEKYPEQGKRHLYKGTIQRWVENVDQSLYVDLRAIVEDDYPREQDAGTTKAIYLLAPTKGYKTFTGVECESAEEIGEALEQESSYYKPLLTQDKNADLFLFLEARDSKKEANAFRKYAQTFNPERAFNTIVLELQGKDHFKIEQHVFAKPADLLSADDVLKEKLVDPLQNPDSKLSIWLEQFPDLKDNIEKWRKLERHNVINLGYALDEKSPFNALEEKVYDLDQFKAFFARHINNKDMIEEMSTSDSVFVTEATFWLEHYQNSSYLEVLLSYFKSNMEELDKRVCTKLCEFLIEMEPDYKKRKKIIENLRMVEPSHPLVKRFEKEEKLFDYLKKEKLTELEKEKESRIAKVKKQISDQIAARQEKTRKEWRPTENNWTVQIGTLLCFLLGAYSLIYLGRIAETDYSHFLNSSPFFAPLSYFIFIFVFPYLGYKVCFHIERVRSKDIEASKVKITPDEKNEMERRIEEIEKDIAHQINHLDDQLREEISVMTDEQLTRELTVNS